MAISFASIMSSAQTQTTENQFNVQARYAAETGINDARYRLINLLDAYNRGTRNFAPKVLGSAVVLLPIRRRRAAARGKPWSCARAR